MVTKTEVITHLRALRREEGMPDGDIFIDRADSLIELMHRAGFEITRVDRDEVGVDGMVVPKWLANLPYQQQSVVLLALRGPDGVRKYHPSKTIHIAYRATVLRAAERGRFLHWGEGADSFMSMDVIGQAPEWSNAVRDFFHYVDELPHHYVSHLAHAAQIIHFKHPDERYRAAWGKFYYRWVEDAHLEPETEATMDNRLNDWGKAPDRLAARGIGVEHAVIPIHDLLGRSFEGCGCSTCREETIECVVVNDHELRRKPDEDWVD